MTKEDKGKKLHSHKREHQHTFFKKRIEAEEPIANDNMAMPPGKKRKS